MKTDRSSLDLVQLLHRTGIFLQTVHKRVAHNWHGGDEYRKLLCKAGVESDDLIFADVEPNRAEYEASKKLDPIHIERRLELYRELLL